MTPDMQAQLQRALSFIAQLQNQITSQQLLIAELQSQIVVAQSVAVPNADALAFAAQLTAANVP